MSDCPYIGTAVINKIPWGDWPGWVWSPQEADEEGGGMMEVRYDVVRDRYFTINTAGPERAGREWIEGVWSCENIWRKERYYDLDGDIYVEEYNLTKEKSTNKPGLIEWVMKMREGEMITRVVVRVESGIHSYDQESNKWVESTDSDGASVEWELSGGDISVPVSPGTELDTNQLAGASQISLQATLNGGVNEDFSLHETQLFSSSKTDQKQQASESEEKHQGTQLKLLVYFARSGSDLFYNKFPG